MLADSEYRHELETDIEPFKGLLLGLFFISVGAGSTSRCSRACPCVLLGIVVGFMALKLVVLWLLAAAFRMPRADASLFSFSLAQGGEFAFVLIAFAPGSSSSAREEAGCSSRPSRSRWRSRRC